MKCGITFPQLEIGTDPDAIRRFAEGAEEIGYNHIVVPEHILGVADPDRPKSITYDHEDTFHESMVLFGHLSAVTSQIRFATGVMVLPQRQTALVAKQAAEVDLLSDGRLSLGVAVGWNEPEFEALGVDFGTRGRRIEEQIEVLRALWTDEVVSYDGRWHEFDGVGINPRPNQQPIPVWIGGGADIVLNRIARMGDGWLTAYESMDVLEEMMDTLREFVEKEGREMSELDIVGRVSFSEDSPLGVADEEEMEERVLAWDELGATHLALRTRDMGLETVEDHLDVAREFKSTVERVGLEFEGPPTA